MRPASVRWLGRASAITSSAGAMLLAGLVPKCPLCIAAVLSAWGIGATASGAFAPMLRPLLVLIALVLAALGVASALLPDVMPCCVRRRTAHRRRW